MPPPADQLRVRFFAILKDRAGTAEASLPHVPDVATALAELAKRYPAIEPLLANTAVAVNRTYVQREHPLRAGDEIALIPPVSGG